MNLLFFDIDGTLITDDDEHLFPEDAKEALREVPPTIKQSAWFIITTALG